MGEGLTVDWLLQKMKQSLDFFVRMLTVNVTADHFRELTKKVTEFVAEDHFLLIARQKVTDFSVSS